MIAGILARTNRLIFEDELDLPLDGIGCSTLLVRVLVRLSFKASEIQRCRLVEIYNNGISKKVFGRRIVIATRAIGIVCSNHF